MRRRAVLQGLAGSVALSTGCLGLGDSPASSDGRVSVTGGAVPERAKADVSAAVLTEPTDESPAKIRLELTNEAGEPRKFEFGSVAPFHFDVSLNGRTRLLMIAEEKADVTKTENRYVPDDRPGLCWLNRPTTADFNAVGDPTVLDSGESVANDYVVLVDPTGMCPVEGSFQFSFEIPAEDAEVRETENGAVRNIEYPTWDLTVTFDPVADGTTTSP